MKVLSAALNSSRAQAENLRPLARATLRLRPRYSSVVLGPEIIPGRKRGTKDEDGFVAVTSVIPLTRFQFPEYRLSANKESIKALFDWFYDLRSRRAM